MSFQVEFQDVVDSTQLVVAERAGAGAAAGLVVVARQQLQGRGRQGRSWLSGPHGLWLSILRRPDVPAAWAAAWTGCLAIAVGDSVRRLCEERLEPWVKWPNDLYLGERKFGGLLAESALVGDRVATVILGLGINLRPPEGGWPRELRERATSLAEEGLDVDRGVVLDTLLDAFSRWEGILLRAGPESIVPSLRVAGRPLFGREVTVDRGTGPEQLLAIDLSWDGALRVREGGGRERLLYAGDVHLGPLR